MLTRKQIANDLRRLGLSSGACVMVHSSLSSLGEVDGGAETVIDALLEVLGPDGTLVMPTLTKGAGDQTAVFDIADSPSITGKITETFRLRPGVKRSMHPTHSVVACGRNASIITEGHEYADTATGEGTPFQKLCDLGGYVLMLGVDLDRCTLIHTAEVYADLPFLVDWKASYRDCDGRIRETVIHKYPGPHRNFIGLDKRLRESGIMITGRVGKGISRLINARDMVNYMTRLLKIDPSAVLCSNPACEDCRIQTGMIRRARLEKEDFTLCTVINSPEEMDVHRLQKLQWFGVETIELGDALTEELEGGSGIDASELKSRLDDINIRVISLGRAAGVDELAGNEAGNSLIRLAELFDAEYVRINLLKSDSLSPEPSGVIAGFADRLAASGRKLVLINSENGYMENRNDVIRFFQSVKRNNLYLGFHPVNFVKTGVKPFLQTFYGSKISTAVGVLYAADGLFGSGESVDIGKGNGEVMELISALRCRSFTGPISVGDPGERFGSSWEERMEKFWHIFDEF